MKHSPFGRVSLFSIRAALMAVMAMVLMAACGGGGGVPYTGVQVRPLSPEFSTRKAVAYSPYRTAANTDGLAAEVIFNFRQRGKSETRQARHLADLDFVHVVVAAQQQQPDLGFNHFALVVGLVGGQHQ